MKVSYIGGQASRCMLFCCARHSTTRPKEVAVLGCLYVNTGISYQKRTTLLKNDGATIHVGLLQQVTVWETLHYAVCIQCHSPFRGDSQTLWTQMGIYCVGPYTSCVHRSSLKLLFGCGCKRLQAAALCRYQPCAVCLPCSTLVAHLFVW